MHLYVIQCPCSVIKTSVEGDYLPLVEKSDNRLLSDITRETEEVGSEFSIRLQQPNQKVAFFSSGTPRGRG